MSKYFFVYFFCQVILLKELPAQFKPASFNHNPQAKWKKIHRFKAGFPGIYIIADKPGGTLVTYELSDKEIALSSPYYFLDQVLPAEASESNKRSSYSNFIINNSVFRSNPKNNLANNSEPLYSLHHYSPEGLILTNSNFDSLLHLTNIDHSVSLILTGNTVPSIKLTQCKSSYMILKKNEATANITIENSFIDYLEISHNRSSPPVVQYDIYGSKLNDLYGLSEDSSAGCLKFNFMSDTLRNISLLTPNCSTSTTNCNEIFFRHCFFSGMVNIEKADGSKKLKVTFSECEFGPNTSLHAGADTIFFQGCKAPAPGLSTSFSQRDTTYLSLTGIDIENLNFIYSKKTFLIDYLGELMPPDIMTSTYEKLLAKFKKESLKQSYEFLDIQYRQFNYARQGTWGRFWNYLDRIWWNYGYDKLEVFWWILKFIVLFFLVNLLFYKWIQEAYPILYIDKPTFRQSKIRNIGYHLTRALKIMVFTIYSFFLIRVDLKTLSFKHPLVTCFFLLQYLIGLTCVLFLTNAIVTLV